jgi:hypothetical protein
VQHGNEIVVKSLFAVGVDFRNAVRMNWHWIKYPHISDAYVLAAGAEESAVQSENLNVALFSDTTIGDIRRSRSSRVGATESRACTRSGGLHWFAIAAVGRAAALRDHDARVRAGRQTRAVSRAVEDCNNGEAFS